MIESQKRMTRHTKHALCLVLEGLPFRQAASRVGLRDHRDLYRYAAKLRLLGLHRQRKIERERILWLEMHRAVRDRILEGTASVPETLRFLNKL